MKKIIFLIPTLSVGGGERVVSELSLNLPNSIDRKIVLFKKDVSYPYKGTCVSLDIPIGLKNPFSKIFHYFLGLLKFREIIKSENPDYVISFGHPANIMNILSGAKALVRVDNFYSASCRGLGGKIYKFFIKILFNRADLIVDVCQESARDLIENFGVKKNKVRVIYNPLNIGEIVRLSREPLPKEHEEIFKSPVIINMGRLNPQKGQEDLIASFLEVKEKIKNAKLVILGKGELEESLKGLSKKFGLEKDVYFLKWQKNPFKYLAHSKVFVLSSLWEGLPYVLLEAMACALPVISFDCKSGPREILAPDTDYSFQTQGIEYSSFGVLVKPGDKKKLAEATISVLSNNELRKKLINKSIKRAGDFETKKIIKEWEFLEKDFNEK